MNNNYKTSIILYCIPVGIFLSSILTFAAASFLEMPTHRGSVYTMLLLYSLLVWILGAIPCMIMSVVGVVFAGIARKEGAQKTTRLFVIGILESVSLLLMQIFWIVLIFTGGMSV